MKQVVIISGKGGTGKTSLTASFARLAERVICADCDVDASDLHLLLSPQETVRYPFVSGYQAVVDPDLCDGCGICEAVCRFDAIHIVPGTNGDGIQAKATTGCEGCGVCIHLCPQLAIRSDDRRCGEWMVSTTRAGTMVHARLLPGGENSGKLVTTVRNHAAKLAEEQSVELVLMDGPPGVGCPVIAAITGTDLVVVVTEPTVSGVHDLERVLALSRHFGIPVMVCTNKWDLNPGMTAQIEAVATQAGALVAGRIRYDAEVTLAQMEQLTAIEWNSPSSGDIRLVWQAIDERVRALPVSQGV